MKAMTKSELADAHARHYNKHSIGICYEGGKDPSGHNADTRTPKQKMALRTLFTGLKMQQLLSMVPLLEPARPSQRRLPPNWAARP